MPVRSPPEPPRFETIDADGNGLITRVELEAHRDAPHARPDADPGLAGSTPEDASPPASENGDAAVGAPRGDLFDRLDQDGDGRLSEAEFTVLKLHGSGRHGGRPDHGPGGPGRGADGDAPTRD